MIINCGKRRLRSYTYGWMIEIQTIPEKGEKKGQIVWVEDSPAYPASLSAGLEMVLEDVPDHASRVLAALGLADSGPGRSGATSGTRSPSPS